MTTPYNVRYDRDVLRKEVYDLLAGLAPDVPEYGTPPERDAWRNFYKQRSKPANVQATAWIEAATWVDVLEPYSQYVGEWSAWHGDYRWQPLGGGHRAVGDAQACLKVVKAMAASLAMIEQRLQYRGARVYNTSLRGA